MKIIWIIKVSLTVFFSALYDVNFRVYKYIYTNMILNSERTRVAESQDGIFCMIHTDQNNTILIGLSFPDNLSGVKHLLILPELFFPFSLPCYASLAVGHRNKVLCRFPCTPASYPCLARWHQMIPNLENPFIFLGWLFVVPKSIKPLAITQKSI